MLYKVVSPIYSSVSKVWIPVHPYSLQHFEGMQPILLFTGKLFFIVPVHLYISNVQSFSAPSLQALHSDFWFLLVVWIWCYHIIILFCIFWWLVSLIIINLCIPHMCFFFWKCFFMSFGHFVICVVITNLLYVWFLAICVISLYILDDNNK